MRIFALAALLVAMFATSAMANAFGNFVPFSNYSATSGSAVYSAAVNVRNFKTKTVTVQGVAVALHANAALSGTVLIQCGPTSSGPWYTCVDNSYAQTGITTTSNAVFTWSDASAYIRASWAKTAGEVNVWLNWQE